jgi:hypothetical protein
VALQSTQNDCAGISRNPFLTDHLDARQVTPWMSIGQENTGKIKEDEYGLHPRTTGEVSELQARNFREDLNRTGLILNSCLLAASLLMQFGLNLHG